MENFTEDDLEVFLDPEQGQEPDFQICMEIADEMKTNYDQVQIVVESIWKNLRSTESKRRLKTVYFLEILVKNCKINFHHTLFSPKFGKILLKILQKVLQKEKKQNSFFESAYFQKQTNSKGN